MAESYFGKQPPFVPGDRVKVFDHLLFKNDIDTPLSFTVRPATVVRWYGKDTEPKYKGTDMDFGKYPSLIDVVFDHRPERESQGHFTTFVEALN